ncbi:hypothetical protein BdWA1_001365 [Babesia duncani]|uniref:Uncharacterized protein n=1 Tax=Babesia duncani TaxID=323732 RepID=A0AAD9UQZ3_9APIC|nr:hypothetical protein BdWA1_001365 [Babesia duncani]
MDSITESSENTIQEEPKTETSTESVQNDSSDQQTNSLQTNGSITNGNLTMEKPDEDEAYLYGLEGIFVAMNRRYNKKSPFWQSDKLDVDVLRKRLTDETH